MFAKKKVKSAANRVNTTKRNNRRRPSLIKRIWNIICWPFRKIAQFIRWLWKKICQFARWIWKKICEINFIGLLNLALLIAIFVLCIMLIIDITSTHRKPVVVVTDPVTVETSIQEIKQNPSVVAEPVMKSVRTSGGYIRPRTETLPIARDTKTNKMVAEPIRVTTAEPNPVTERQIAKVNDKMYGDIIIDNRGDAKLLNNGTEIDGNLYLQNMRKYVLPCDIKITGNMFIRDVSMLQFCGDFEITGNIYVSPRSSFGPIPSSARLGGQVIL
ncbi:MAG: hypothetical protein J6S74_01890 [Alphaproteobacteria bacterium]|nr:hypothetical protein [Alphaproteobacteria bacterium]